ncbi:MULTISPECIES: TIGR00282 family metallophosphoesterase [unclassified Pseudodesulfovibrio]|uniref:TIGR00282 family metallophosphoesterase n=1 Tax=unclassified Pseudodesulfovibrio TaxID=2661612 RepID=UPI000FEBC0BC|nr:MULTISPECIES: TIGR00282 family metallophosphoesterase [unclassified Pseudodesulfovibrio]MCJ2165757.1 TIGR00282 family metallophosphoesterase [Pseudodesulfovibrio sp. S3-i]RWU02873.1 TIGR00282 family metallophosphoesterase [Pseudodesulfovibrio sp. S3]
MRILFLGDIVGRPGRRAVMDNLARIKAEESIDLAFANGENASSGYGLKAKHAKELFKAGVDGITGGNHTWKYKDLYSLLDSDGRLLRPHNYPDQLPGRGVQVFRKDNLPPVAVINVIGRTFMPPIDCPFASIETIVDGLPADIPIQVVDFHAEATGEKIAMGYFLEGKVSAVVGTHTHVQTNDAKILPGGTAYLTDLGMCGATDSCLGMKPEIILDRYLTGLPRRLEAASGPGVLQGAIFDIDDTTGKAVTMATFNQDSRS